jgi:hypothetical protein
VARAFTDADLIQSNAGVSASSASITVTLPSGTTEGNTVLVLLRGFTFLALGDIWDISVAESTIPALQILTRADVPAGESSWTINLSNVGNSIWAWRVEEWANIGFVPLVSTSTGSDLAPTATTLSTGNTGAFTGEPFVMAVALFSMYKGSADGQPWPSVTGVTNGFTITDTIDNGDGTTATGVRLVVARYYGTAAQDGPLETTATFSGTLTNVNTQAVLAVFRAAESTDAAPPVVISA